MPTKKRSVEIDGIGTHQIDFKLVDDSARQRVMQCIEKHGKISVLIGGGVAKGLATNGFEQLID